MKVLAEFEINNKKYVYYTSDDKNILFGIGETGRGILEVNSEESELMKSLASKIFLSSDVTNHVDLGFKTYKNKTYRMFLDKVSELRYFLELKDGKLVQPDFNEIADLTILYNDNSVMYYKDEEDSQLNTKLTPKNSFKKLIYAVVKGIGITVIVTVFLTVIFFGTIVFNHVPYGISQILTQNDLRYEEVVDSFNTNNKVGDFERDYFLNSCQSFVEENQKYFNEALVRNRLETFNINYFPTSKNLRSLGTYNFILNIISIARTENENSMIFEVVYPHEMIHLFSAHNNLGNGIDEALTELMSAEYFKSSTTEKSYSDMCNIDRALFEIIGTEPFLRFKFQGGIKHIINALCDIIPDENKAYRLVSKIDELYNSRNEEVSSEKLNEVRTEIFNAISEYYSSKYNRNVEDDVVVMKYLVDSKIIDNRTLYLNTEFDSYPIVNIQKPYFSQQLKLENPGGVLLVRQDDEPFIIHGKTYKVDLPLEEANELLEKIAYLELCKPDELTLTFKIVDGKEIVETATGANLEIPGSITIKEIAITEENRIQSSNIKTM